MRIHAYSLYDVKSLTYSPPFFAVSDGVAVRMLADLVSDLNTSVGRHPKDYTLYRVGEFDDANGELLPTVPRDHVTDAVALVRKQSDVFTGERSSNGATTDYVASSSKELDHG